MCAVMKDRSGAAIYIVQINITQWLLCRHIFHVAVTMRTGFASSFVFAPFPLIQYFTSGKLILILCPCLLSAIDNLGHRKNDAVVGIGMKFEPRYLKQFSFLIMYWP